MRCPPRPTAILRVVARDPRRHPVTDYDFSDRTDFENADRGLIAPLRPGIVRNAGGDVVWDVDTLAAVTSADCPPTANPSLWRQAQLTAKQGLYEVVDGVYQLRGLDLSNMTLIESE